MGQRRVINWYSTDTVVLTDPYAGLVVLDVDFTLTAIGSRVAPDMGPLLIPQKLSSFAVGGKNADGFIYSNGLGAMQYSFDTGAAGDPTVPWSHTTSFTLESISKINVTTPSAPDPGSVTIHDINGFSFGIIDYVSPNQKAWQVITPVSSYLSPATAHDGWLPSIGMPIPMNAAFKTALTYNGGTGTLTLYVGTTAVYTTTVALTAANDTNDETIGFCSSGTTNHGIQAYTVYYGVCKSAGELYQFLGDGE